jgi:tetratricopeptide (TPR) repeat protein
MLADVLIAENRLEEAGELIDHARQSLSGDEVLAELAARRAQIAFLAGDIPRAHDEAEIALAIADPRGLSRIMADAVQTKACALSFEQRMTEANAMMPLGLQIALDADLTDQSLRGYFNVAEFTAISGQTQTAASLLEEGLALARERGNRAWERDLLAQRVGVHAFAGEWDEALALSDGMLAAGEDDSARLARSYAPLILASRGDAAGLEAWLDHPVVSSEWRELARMEDAGRAVALRGIGRLDEAIPALLAVAPTFASWAALTSMFYLGSVLDGLIEAGQIPLVEELLGFSQQHGAPVNTAELWRGSGLLLVRRGEFREAEGALLRAVERLRQSGNPLATGRALLDHGTILNELGRADEAAAALQEARTMFRRLRAEPWLERIDRALAPTAA